MYVPSPFHLVFSKAVGFQIDRAQPRFDFLVCGRPVVLYVDGERTVRLFLRIFTYDQSPISLTFRRWQHLING